MNAYRSRKGLVMLKEFLAELLGTGVLIMFGCGCVAQAVLSGGSGGGMLSINIGWGLGVLVGVLIAGPISGKNVKVDNGIIIGYNLPANRPNHTFCSRCSPKPSSEPIPGLCWQVSLHLLAPLHGRSVPGGLSWLLIGPTHL